MTTSTAAVLSFSEAAMATRRALAHATVEREVFKDVRDYGEPAEWVIVLRRLADVLDTYDKATR